MGACMQKWNWSQSLETAAEGEMLLFSVKPYFAFGMRRHIGYKLPHRVIKRTKTQITLESIPALYGHDGSSAERTTTIVVRVINGSVISIDGKKTDLPLVQTFVFSDKYANELDDFLNDKARHVVVQDIESLALELLMRKKHNFPAVSNSQLTEIREQLTVMLQLTSAEV